MSKKVSQIKFTTANPPKSHSKVISVQLQQISLPVFEEKLTSGRPYVRYGNDNLFPQFLEMLANKSALHGAIVQSKVDYAFGKGLDASEIKNDTLVQQFINHPNGHESLDDIYKKCLYDYIVYGAFALNVLWADNGDEIAQIYHCGIDKLRSGYKDEYKQVKKWYYSDNWIRNGATKFAEIDAYSATDRKGSQILYTRDYNPSAEYYGLPSYVGALNSIATDAEISNFNLANIKNGMTPSKMITFTEGEPSEEEELVIKRQLEELYTGSDNAGKFMLSFVNDPDHAPKIETLGGDGIADEFLQLQNSVLQQILSGHRVTSPLLVGIRDTGGGLGSNTDELVTAFQIFMNTVIKPIQNRVVGVLNDLLKYSHKWNGGMLKPTSNSPIEFTFSESTLVSIMTVDELRAKIGLPPMAQRDNNIDSTATATDTDAAQ